MPITRDGIILPRVQAKPPATSLVRAVPAGIPVAAAGGRAGTVAIETMRRTAERPAALVRGMRPPVGPRLAGPPARRRGMRMPQVARPRDWGYTVPTRREGAVGDDDTARLYEAADIFLTRQIAAVINAYYFGHPWAVEVSHRQGVAMISIPVMMGNQRYIIKLDTLKTDPGMRCVIRACGEILERYQIPRNNFRPDHFAQAVTRIPAWKRARAGQVPA